MAILGVATSKICIEYALTLLHYDLRRNSVKVNCWKQIYPWLHVYPEEKTELVDANMHVEKLA